MSFKSDFLKPEILQLINACNNDNLEQVKAMLLGYMKESPKFKKQLKHHYELERITSPVRLQFFVYNYILAAEDLKS